MENNLSTLMAPVKRFFWRHNYSLFIVVMVGLVAVAMYMVLGIINKPNTTAPVDTSSTITFDRATMDRVEQLHAAGANNTFTLPTSQRVDPFSER